MDRRAFLAGLALGCAAPRVAAAPGMRLPGLRRLSLKNAHTGESFEGSYRDDNGPIPRVMQELSVFLRDHHSGEKIAIDPGVIDFLAAVLESVGQTSATILSAYRTPETNAMLARTTFGVAENSQHLYGRALDVSLGTRLYDAMEAGRGMKRGGVGWYPHSGFIHLDSGPVRNWNLDDTGLGNLLFDPHSIVIGSRGQILIEGPARLIVGGGKTPIVLRTRSHPLTWRERMILQHQLARAEFLARHR
jgi:uncharacterized protein YcbK (DUF882 family)